MSDLAIKSWLGEPARALKVNGREVSGYLILFGSPETPDLVGDYFDRQTWFGKATTTPLWLNHCQPVAAKGVTIQITDPIGEGELEVDEQGIIVRGLLDARYAYLAEIASQLGWSSGTASHLVERSPVKAGVYHIDRWPLGLDASLTPTPAEPRTLLIRPVKNRIIVIK
jgi:hypothetical protein